MGYEFIHEDAITPQRIYAMMRLINEFGHIKKRELFELLQPDAILDIKDSAERSREGSERKDSADHKDAADRNYRASKRLGLIAEEDDKERTVQLKVPSKVVETADSFRAHMQAILLGVIEDHQDCFLLNQFAAWYSVQGERVFEYSRMDIETRFNEQLYPAAETRAFRERSNYNAWRTWAEFLGWGWSMAFGSRRDLFVPDATMRIRPLMHKLLPKTNPIAMSRFFDNLKPLCPELDGGLLFERCWEASRGSEVRGNRLSLMLSTALRVLNSNGEIELIERKDASESWRLFPSQSHITQVTHVCRRTTA